MSDGPPVALHRLSNVDSAAATATCAVCGPVEIRVRGNGKAHECMTVRRRNRGRGGDVAAWGTRKLSFYGLTVDDYESLLTRSGGACEICRKPMDPPHVDHCHATGEVRGLLCRSCNLGIGFLKDDPAVLTAALDYLRAERPGA